MLISGLSIGEVYPKLLEVLLGSPESSPRAQRTREQLGLQLHVQDLTQNILVHPVRDLNYRFMVAEFLWIMADREDVETLARYNPEMRKFSDDGKTLAGAYGPRLRKYMYADGYIDRYYDQLTWCVQKLREGPDSRQAVAQIWTPCPGSSKDIPCTLSLQFFIRKKGGEASVPEQYRSGSATGAHDLKTIVGQPTLHCVANMRSSDAWLGLPYDFFAFSMIANCLAGELGVKPGSLTMQLGSSHLYEQHWEKATELVARWQESKTVASPELPELSSCAEFDRVLRRRWPVRSCLEYYFSAVHQTNKLNCLEVLINATKPR